MNAYLGGGKRVALKCCCPNRHGVADLVWGYFNDDDDGSDVKASLLEKENDDDDLALVHTFRKPKISLGRCRKLI